MNSHDQLEHGRHGLESPLLSPVASSHVPRARSAVWDGRSAPEHEGHGTRRLTVPRRDGAIDRVSGARECDCAVAFSVSGEGEAEELAEHFVMTGFVNERTFDSFRVWSRILRATCTHTSMIDSDK